MSIEKMEQSRYIKDIEIVVIMHDPEFRILDEIDIYLEQTLDEIQACLEAKK